jgi:hypothetical protein
MEFAATLIRGDTQGLQMLAEYDAINKFKLNEALKVRDLSMIKRMLSEVKLNPKGPGSITDMVMTYSLGLMLVDGKIDPEALRTKEAKDMMTDLLCTAIGEVATGNLKPLATTLDGRRGQEQGLLDRGALYSIDGARAAAREGGRSALQLPEWRWGDSLSNRRRWIKVLDEAARART